MEARRLERRLLHQSKHEKTVAWNKEIAVEGGGRDWIYPGCFTHVFIHSFHHPGYQ